MHLQGVRSYFLKALFGFLIAEAGFLAFKLNFLAGDLISLFLVGFTGGLVYLAGLAVFDRKQLMLDARWFWQKIH